MPKYSTKVYLLQYLIDNYVDLTPITLREIGAAVKEPNDKNIYKLLEELKREGRIVLLEPMDTDHGAEVIMQLGN
jgi:hypothetical protein